MKRLLYIPALLLCYVLFCGKSCNSGEELDSIRDSLNVVWTVDSLTSASAGGQLSDDVLRNYEEAALQKFGDFTDYFRILSDTALDPKFKEHARWMVSTLFLPGDAVFVVSDDGGLIRRRTAASEVFAAGRIYGAENCPYNPVNPMVEKGFTRINDTLYDGIISYDFTGKDNLRSPGKEGCFRKGSAEILLIMRRKFIGADTLRTWNVLLGNVNLKR